MRLLFLTVEGGWCAPEGLVYEMETPPLIDWSKMPMPQGVRGGLVFTSNDMGPDGRVTWNTERENDMEPICDKCAFGTHGGCDQQGRNTVVCRCSCETAYQARRMIREDREPETSATVKNEGAKVNADPMLARAQAALAEIGSFERVEVEHVQDITEVTNSAGEVVGRFPSGAIAVDITIRGYLR
jgi:hypothetical protein